MALLAFWHVERKLFECVMNASSCFPMRSASPCRVPSKLLCTRSLSQVSPQINNNQQTVHLGAAATIAATTLSRCSCGIAPHACNPYLPQHPPEWAIPASFSRSVIKRHTDLRFGLVCCSWQAQQRSHRSKLFHQHERLPSQLEAKKKANIIESIDRKPYGLKPSPMLNGSADGFFIREAAFFIERIGSFGFSSIARG